MTLPACSQLDIQIHLQPFEGPEWGVVFRGDFCSVALLAQLLVLTKSVLIDLGRDLKQFMLCCFILTGKWSWGLAIFWEWLQKLLYNCSIIPRFTRICVVACPCGDVYIHSLLGLALHDHVEASDLNLVCSELGLCRSVAASALCNKNRLRLGFVKAFFML